jgi:hypothetical protein
MWVNIVVEDQLSEAVLRRILSESTTRFDVLACYGGCGYQYIRDRVPQFSNASRGTPYVVLVDLESDCPPKQIMEWLPTSSRNLLLRIAVREVESWLLGDRAGFASFLNVGVSRIPRSVDAIEYPKEYLVALARRTRKRSLREAIVPRPGSTAKVGPDYNGVLSYFVSQIWNISEAAANSVSLHHAIAAINRFDPLVPADV